MSNKQLDKYLNEIQGIDETIGSAIMSGIGAMSPVTMGIMSVTGLISLGLNLYNQFLAKNKNRCERMKGYDKQICYIELRIEGTGKYLNQLQSSRQDCKNTKDPNKCNQKISDKSRKLNMEITKLREELYKVQKAQRGGV